MRRICIIGVSGAGKTTLARRLAERLSIPRVELDALYWEPGWQPAPTDVFRARVREATKCSAWIADGNYSGVRDITWPLADTFVWLELPLHVILWRLIRRIITRCWTREVLWNGNRETFWRHFVPTDSLIVWALKTHPRYRREYEPLLARRALEGCAVVRLHSQGAVADWLASISTQCGDGTRSSQSDRTARLR